VLPLIASLEDLRLRPYVAETLAKIGQPAARGPLAERFANERHKDTRAALGAALVKLGAKSELAAPLIRFMGTPDPLADGVEWARRSGVLPLIGTTEGDLERLGAAAAAPVSVKFKMAPAVEGRYRLVARAKTTDEKTGRVTFAPCADRAATPSGGDPALTLEFAAGPARELFLDLSRELGLPSGPAKSAREICIALTRTANLSVEGVAVVPLADDLPPPPPEPWEGAPAPANVMPASPSSAASASTPH
jgi:hypothetical protein